MHYTLRNGKGPSTPQKSALGHPSTQTRGANPCGGHSLQVARLDWGVGAGRRTQAPALGGLGTRSTPKGQPWQSWPGGVVPPWSADPSRRPSRLPGTRRNSLNLPHVYRIRGPRTLSTPWFLVTQSGRGLVRGPPRASDAPPGPRVQAVNRICKQAVNSESGCLQSPCKHGGISGGVCYQFGLRTSPGPSQDDQDTQRAGGPQIRPTPSVLNVAQRPGEAGAAWTLETPLARAGRPVYRLQGCTP